MAREADPDIAIQQRAGGSGGVRIDLPNRPLHRGAIEVGARGGKLTADQMRNHLGAIEQGRILDLIDEGFAEVRMLQWLDVERVKL